MRIFLAVVLGLLAGAAQAEFRVCNESGVTRSVAVGYGSEGDWTSEGWWVIQPGDCAVAIKGALQNRYIYWRAFAKDEEFAHEDYLFCVTPDPFTIAGSEDCAARGYDEAGFRVADTGEKAADFTLTLNTETLAIAALPPATLTGPIPANGPAFVPGTLGEPFAQTALLQGCGPSELGFSCTLYADGWRYMAAQNGINPAEILDVLASLPVNTSVMITGEITAMGDITAEVNLSQIEPGPADPFAQTRANLQGDWVSFDDPQAKIRIEGSEFTDMYGDELLGVSVLTLAATCPDGTQANGEVLSMVPMGQPDATAICWGLDQISPTELVAVYLGRGNSLTYIRP